MSSRIWEHFLPREKHEAVRATFAFRDLMRDAIAVSSQPGDDLEKRIELFRDRLDEIYDRRLELPLPQFRDGPQRTLAAMIEIILHFQIPKQHFLDMAEGRRMELTVARYATWNSLEKYFDHTAGSFGRILACILGSRHSDAARQATALANAIFFTMSLRKLAMFAGVNRIELPLEDLARFGYSERQLIGGVANDAFRALMRFEIDRARKLYREGAEGICWLVDDGSRFAVAAVTMLHAAVLDAIENQGYDVFHRPIDPPLHRKARAMFAAWRLAQRSEGEPLPDVI